MKQRSDGRWERTVTVNGKRIHFYSTEKTEKKAEADISRQLLEFHAEANKIRHHFGSLVQMVLDQKQEEVEDATYKSYLYASYKLRDLFDCNIEDITPQRFSAVLDDLASKQYSRSTISKVKIIASLACDAAILRGVNVHNFAKGAKIPRKSKRADQKTPLSDEEIRLVYESASEPFGMFAFLLLFTGMRRGEALALRKKDINFRESVICVSRSVSYPVNQPVIKTTKTDSSTRVIPIMPILEKSLKLYVSPLKDNDYLFGGDQPISKTAVVKRWANYTKNVGLDATPHQLRHTFSFLQYRSGTDAKTLQGLLGHANVQTSLNIYTAFSKDVAKASMDKANDLASDIVSS